MNILDTIIEHKRDEISFRKEMFSTAQLRQVPGYERKCLSLKAFLTDPAKTGIIAEFKRRSPSKGIINDMAPVEEVTAAYAAHGASGISILTDEPFFGGGPADVQMARFNEVPILRKDFMIDEYQVEEAKAMGADVILLIAACLSPEQVQQLAAYAKVLGLEVLLEIHDTDELAHICSEVDMVGVNNRDLKTFTVDVNRSIELAPLIPADKIKISESGISDVAVIHLLREHGYQGFLIGENFMKAPDPAVAFASFVNELKKDT